MFGRVGRLSSVIVKRVLSVLVIFSVFPLYSCANEHVVKKQTEYHEGFEEIEQYVLETMGEYIRFEEPCIDDGKERIDWSLLFVSEYLKNDSAMSQYPPLDIMEDTRALMNQYLVSNPDSFVNNYHVFIQIGMSIDGMEPYEIVGCWENRLYGHDNEYEASLCAVRYYELLNRTTIDGFSGLDIRQISLSRYQESELEDVLYIIDQLPNLEIVIVEEGIAETIQDQRPDIEVIGVPYNPYAL